MEIINKNAALLSNHEVHKLLAETRQQMMGIGGKKRKGDQLKNLATIAYQTFKYLDESASGCQTDENLRQCVAALDKFRLTRSEKLQIVNNRPTTAVEIQLLVEESEERLSDDQVEELLALVRQHLPAPKSSPTNARAD